MRRTRTTAKGVKTRSVINLSSPDQLLVQFYLTCFRGRKFARGRFARLIMDRVANQDDNEKLLVHLPAEMVGLFLAREVIPVTEDHSPANECFEMSDGSLLEFVGDNMEAADVLAHALITYDEESLLHVVELLKEHPRTWFQTMTLDQRDELLRELGFYPALDDADRLFERWHPHLLLRKLQATLGLSREKMDANLATAQQVTPDDINAFVNGLKGQEKKMTLRRLNFLGMCQLVKDTKRKVQMMTNEQMAESGETALRVLAAGATASGLGTALLSGREVLTLYRLGLATGHTNGA